MSDLKELVDAGAQRFTAVRSSSRTGIGVAGTGTGDATGVIGRPWWLLLLVRVGRVYFQALAALVTAQGIGILNLEIAAEVALGGQWSKLGAAAMTAALIATATLIQNAAEYLTNLDSKWATFHG